MSTTKTSVSVPAIFGGLRDIGYDGAVNLECSTNGDPGTTQPAAAAMLRALAG